MFEGGETALESENNRVNVGGSYADKNPSQENTGEFLIIYELEGCQKAVNFLSEYYGVKRMKIILNGRKVGKGYEAYYFEGKAYFTKRGLKKRNVLHEFYHFLADSKGLDISERVEERDANHYSRAFLE
jgi:hypothetical protein